MIDVKYNFYDKWLIWQRIFLINPIFGAEQIFFWQMIHADFFFLKRIRLKWKEKLKKKFDVTNDVMPNV